MLKHRKRFTIKPSVLRITMLLNISFCSLLGLTLNAAALQPVLKERIVIHDGIVTLGDLFDFAGNSSQIAVFRSPDRGKTGIISAKRVALAAEKHGLHWSNPGAIKRIQVTRPSRKFSVGDLTKLVHKALVEQQGFGDPHSIQINLAHSTKPIHLDPRRNTDLIIKQLNYYRSSGKFRAVIGADQTGEYIDDLIVVGVAKEMISVAVPVRQITRYSLIRASDVQLVKIPKARQNGHLALDKHDLIGKVARRNLRANHSVRLDDVEQRKLIRKNALVEIIYESGGLNLKSEGRALTDASEGELLTVLNTFSKRNIEGIAIGPGLVSVSTSQRITSVYRNATPHTTSKKRRRRTN